MRKERKKRRRSLKKIGVVLVVLVLFAVIIGIGVYQMQGLSQTEKKPAQEYFEIFEPTVDDGEFRNPSISEGGSYENSSVLVIYGLTLKIKAVGGDASSFKAGDGLHKCLLKLSIRINSRRLRKRLVAHLVSQSTRTKRQECFNSH
jgi:hypothetical protein